MSSPESPDRQDDRQGNRQDDRAEGEPSTEVASQAASSEESVSEGSVSEGSTSKESTSEAVVRATECPNCGRRFVGDYCPSCGQEAGLSVTVTGVAGGFLRELVDVENGFWPTFIGLSLCPGKTLHKYLSGVRKELVSPGRYLLAAVVVTVGADQLSRWVGALPPPVVDPYMRAADGKRNAFDASVAYFGSAVEQVPFLPFLLIAVPLAAGLWTFFRDRSNGGAGALAVGSFLTGHTLFLAEGTGLALAWTGSLSGLPSAELPFGAAVALVTGYIGIACWRCFGPGWKPAAKGAPSGAWAWAEFAAIVMVVTAGTAYWLLTAYPGAYHISSPEGVPRWILLIFAGIFSVPLLLHAGVEAYYRLR
ncbi:DUF3667 domain-containing protein [Salinibacter grassmerensis]|uniref:DUF3667 domain-containing protein n=1 Tax=Salinibacter grassmerensis TaxID=3040353 RepID=UPI0021E8F1B3|nr:DUF3667 domain-containing protein [Salinibacter grassmerensis]